MVAVGHNTLRLAYDRLSDGWGGPKPNGAWGDSDSVYVVDVTVDVVGSP